MSRLTLAPAKPSQQRPIQATAIACLISIALHTQIWHAWQGMAPPPLPEVKPPLVVEVALTSAPSPQPPTAVVAPPPPVPPAIVKPQPAPPEKAKAKPVSPPKPKLAVKPVVPKKPAPPDKPKADPAPPAPPTFSAPPPLFTPAPAQASPKPAPAPVAAQPLVKAAYSAPGLKNPPTRYPKIAQMRQWEGTVTLEVKVLADGSAGEVRIVSGSGHEILDESAVEQVKAWRFIPAHRGDKTVEDWVRV
ncbi:MAG: TonB family protein, partial [Methylovulum sp.]|nr:TonB family protein [Methylovulum sp.]